MADLALLSYVVLVLTIHIPWHEVAARTVTPHFALTAEYLTVIVAVFGTTISPYLFFWQASQEVEELNADPAAGALAHAPEGAADHLRRIKIDTYLGMAFSNIVAFCIILGTASTLNVAGITDIQTSAQAAEALRPLAGDFSFVLFALGIIGTGMIAVPVLAGSAAYAVAETFEWKRGPRPQAARGARVLRDHRAGDAWAASRWIFLRSIRSRRCSGRR